MTAHLPALSDRILRFEPGQKFGRVTRIASTYVEANGPDAPVGALCSLETSEGRVLSTVVSADSKRIALAPLDPLGTLHLGAKARLVSTANVPRTGDAFLGRAVDGLGRPLDGGAAIAGEDASTTMPDPLDRITPRRPMTTGIRVIDGLLPLAQGQRIGIFAAPGVGKTTLLNQIGAQVEADRHVVCLVGERGREVHALWSALDDRRRSLTTLVAATSDHGAALRTRAVEQALALAMRWRAEGHHVLLLIDSATRYAMALREVGLASGEPPTVRAYTPGVFAALPKLVERCGAVRCGGAITAVMTVLCETDDVDDPVAEIMKSLLDGHIVLSRQIAEQGRHPAVDVPRSISRLASGLMSPEHRALAQQALASLSAYETARPLIEAGVYAAGANADIDAAIRRRPGIEAFLAQGETRSAPHESLASLKRALEA